MRQYDQLEAIRWRFVTPPLYADIQAIENRMRGFGELASTPPSQSDGVYPRIRREICLSLRLLPRVRRACHVR